MRMIESIQSGAKVKKLHEFREKAEGLAFISCLYLFE